MEVKIGKDFYTDFKELSFSSSLDSVGSTFSFQSYFNTDSLDHKKAFKPLSFHPVVIYNDKKEIILNGILLNTTADSQKNPGLVSCTGYSKCAIINDVNIPLNRYPLESRNLTLKQLAEKYVTDFGVKVVVSKGAEAKANEKIAKAVADPNDTIKGFLQEIAILKNIVLSHDNNGDIVLLNIDNKTPAKFKFDDKNTSKMTLSVNGQNMHSEISSIKQPNKRKKNKGSTLTDTLKNTLVQNYYKPKVKKVSAGEDSDVKTAVKGFYMDELENISISIELDSFNQDISVGDFIEVVNPEIFIFKPAKLLIKSTSVSENETSDFMALTCVLPEAFSGEKPKNIFDYE